MFGGDSSCSWVLAFSVSVGVSSTGKEVLANGN